MCNKFTYIKKFTNNMDALLVGGGLAAGGWLLNAKQENERNKGVSNKSPDVFDNRVQDSRMYDRQVMRTHLGKDNNVDALYLDRPKSGRSDNSVGSSRSLTGEMRNNSEFTHNNMVPFYGSNVKQNTDLNSSTGLVERFTGVSHLDKSKEEVKPMFGLNQENIYGTQNSNDRMMERYSASRYHQGTPLIEPVRVGPGLNQGYSAQPSGGFQQADAQKYAQQPSVDELRVKTNPKISYEGRIVRGFQGTRRGMEPVVSQNRVIRFHSYGDIPRMNTTVVTTGEASRENFQDKKTNRQDTLYSYASAAGPAVVKAQESHESYSNQTTHKQALDNFGLRNAQSQNRESKLKIQYCSEARKEDSKDLSYMGHATSLVNKIVAPVQDILRPTIKETNIHDSAPERNFNSVEKRSTAYDTNDTARTTIKETAIHDNRAGPLSVLSTGRSANPEPTKKTARETLKQWVDYSNPTGPAVMNTVQNMDNAKKTVKETINETNRKGIATNSRGPAGYLTNPKNAPDTARQHLSTVEYSGQANQRTYGAYSVTDTVAPETHKQHLSNNEYTGNAEGEIKPTSYSDIYNATLNDLKEGISKGRAPTKSSIKQVSDVGHLGEFEGKDTLENRKNFGGVTPIQNTSLNSESVNMTTDKCQLDTGSRLQATDLEAYINNPYTQSLNSSA